MFNQWKQGVSDLVVEDLGNALVTPAFVNAHTHLCMLAFRGVGGLASLEGNVVKDLYFRLEHNLEPEDVRAFTRLGAVEALLSGTGFVWEHYYFGNMLTEALQDVGLKWSNQRPHYKTLMDREKIVQKTHGQKRMTLLKNSTATQTWTGSSIGPHATDTVSDELWRKIATVAEEEDPPYPLSSCSST